MNASEPVMKCRERGTHCQNLDDFAYSGISIAETCLPAMRQSSLRRHELYTGYSMELERSFGDVKEEAVRLESEVSKEVG